MHNAKSKSQLIFKNIVKKVKFNHLYIPFHLQKVSYCKDCDSTKTLTAINTVVYAMQYICNNNAFLKLTVWHIKIWRIKCQPYKSTLKNITLIYSYTRTVQKNYESS